MNHALAFILAGAVGVLVALEPTVNSGLGKYITPRLATLHSFIVGTLAVIIINIVSGGFKEYRLIAKAPPYFWFGGFIGLGVVFLGALVTPIIGVASTVTIMVAVQLLTSIVIDTFGLFGINRVPLDAGRIIGAAILVVAARLVVR